MKVCTSSQKGPYVMLPEKRESLLILILETSIDRDSEPHAIIKERGRRKSRYASWQINRQGVLKAQNPLWVVRIVIVGGQEGSYINNLHLVYFSHVSGHHE